MSLYKFVKSIQANIPINLFNNGDHVRDFTYIDDVVSILIRLIKKPSKDKIPYNIFNTGSNRPTKLITFVKTIENILNKKSKIKKFALQAGDVHKTHANINKIQKYIGVNNGIS